MNKIFIGILVGITFWFGFIIGHSGFFTTIREMDDIFQEELNQCVVNNQKWQEWYDSQS